MTLLGEVREAAATVAARARHVRLVAGALERFADALADEASPGAPSGDPAHRGFGDDSLTVAFVVTLDAINFGSGWFPLLRKRAGRSGYFTVAGALEDHFRVHGAWSASALRELGAPQVARVLGQTGVDPAIDELMALFARSLNELGAFLERDYGGRFEALVGSAGGSAETLVASLVRMPFFRDVSRYQDLRVPFYKRAQLTVADLFHAFEGRGPGRFVDLDRLTIFADNLVPHVLRRAGVLVYDEALAARVDAGERLEAGSAEEVEIRALGVHAAELMVDRIRDRRPAASAYWLDWQLWHRGQAPEVKAHPRHRARSVYY